MKHIEFYKIESTGNDFVLINGEVYNRSLFSTSLIRQICDRRFGIGGDGFLFVERFGEKSIKIQYHNADGSKAEMCGNGLRAAARFANETYFGNENKKFKISASDGLHQVEILSHNKIKAELLISNMDEKLNLDQLEIPKELSIVGFVNTGAPHLVLSVEKDIEQFNLQQTGSALRKHLMFGKQGTNINILQQIDTNTIQVRTYERGVEAETLSCGTGVTACSLLFNKEKAFSTNVVTAGGLLTVASDGKHTFLTGDSRIVFKGVFCRREALL
jgi:diaminopimelate epimerase